MQIKATKGNIPEKSGAWRRNTRNSIAALLLLFLIPAANAATGYYESFSDPNDTSTPTAEPTSWYTYSQQNSANNPYSPVFGGALHQSCAMSTGATACSGSGAYFTLSGTAIVSNTDYNFALDYSFTRDSAPTTNARLVSSYVGFCYSTSTASCVQIALWGWSISGGVLYFVGNNQCANTSNSGATELNAAGTITISYLASTSTISINIPGGHGGTITASCAIASPGSSTNAVTHIAMINFQVTGNSDCANGTGAYCTSNLDNFVWNSNDGATYTTPSAPAAPAGLTAKTTTACSGTPGNYISRVELRWPLSTSDPDQVTGTLGYKIYANGVNLGFDSTTGQDGDGKRYNLITFTSPGSTCNGVIVFWIVADNAGLSSPNSCSVTVNDNTLNMSDTCGSGSGGVAGNPSLSTNNPIGQMVQTISNAWGFDWSWIIGAIIMAVCIAAAWMMGDFVVAVIIFLVAVTNVKIGLWPEWTIFAFVFIAIALAGNRLFGKKGDGADQDSA